LYFLIKFGIVDLIGGRGMAIRYASDNYYAEERKLYGESYRILINDLDVLIILRKLCSHYRVRVPRVRFWGYRDSGSANGREIRLSHNPSMGLIVHEFGHFVQTRSDIFKEMLGRVSNKGTTHHGLHFQIVLNRVHLYSRGKGYWVEQIGRRMDKRKIRKST